jgi:hypothetical protein
MVVFQERFRTRRNCPRSGCRFQSRRRPSSRDVAQDLFSTAETPAKAAIESSVTLTLRMKTKLHNTVQVVYAEKMEQDLAIRAVDVVSKLKQALG